LNVVTNSDTDNCDKDVNICNYEAKLVINVTFIPSHNSHISTCIIPVQSLSEYSVKWRPVQ
jgi:hypothetical protein